MKKLNLILSLLIVSILTSGCSQKDPEIVYKQMPIYDFQKVDFKGAYIEMTTEQEICRPLLQELNKIYKETKYFYDEQFDDYKKQNQKKDIK